jgi:hypothetical protein
LVLDLVLISIVGTACFLPRLKPQIFSLRSARAKARAYSEAEF